MNLLKNNQATWLWDIAEEDVYILRGLHSQPMFDKLKGMILSSWTHDGEQGQQADTFGKSYSDNDPFNKWRYNLYRMAGCIPRIIHMRGVTWIQRIVLHFLESLSLEVT
jgi:hypothetical protein